MCLPASPIDVSTSHPLVVRPSRRLVMCSERLTQPPGPERVARVGRVCTYVAPMLNQEIHLELIRNENIDTRNK